MRAPYLHLTVIGCVLCWAMFALHIPAVLHQVTDHDALPWIVLSLMSLFVVGGVAGIWLLRRPRAQR